MCEYLEYNMYKHIPHKNQLMDFGFDLYSYNQHADFSAEYDPVCFNKIRKKIWLNAALDVIGMAMASKAALISKTTIVNTLVMIKNFFN